MRHKYLLSFLLLVTAIFSLNRAFGWSSLLSDPASLSLLRQTAAENLPMALLLYCLITIVGCVVLALPGLIFGIAAGSLFGPFWGTFACSVATTIGAGLSFWIGRYFLQQSVRPLVMKNRHLRKILFDEADKSVVYMLLITRIMPIFPYNLQIFAYGITDVRFTPYICYSFLFMLPGTAVSTLAAAGINGGFHRKLHLIAAVVLLFFILVVTLLLQKRFAKEEQACV